MPALLEEGDKMQAKYSGKRAAHGTVVAVVVNVSVSLTNTLNTPLAPPPHLAPPCLVYGLGFRRVTVSYITEK